MNISEIRALGVSELKQKLEDAHRELFDLRFKLETKQLVNHRELPRVRKGIAQLNTIIREKELGIR